MTKAWKIPSMQRVKRPYHLFNQYKPSLLFMGHWQTVQNLIRCHRMRCLIMFLTVCLQNILLRFEEIVNDYPTTLKFKIESSN